MDEAGSGANLVQTWTRESEHSYLSAPEYAAMLDALMGWVDHGKKPTAQTVAALCDELGRDYYGGCHFDVDYHPRPLEARVPPR